MKFFIAFLFALSVFIIAPFEAIHAQEQIYEAQYTFDFYPNKSGSLDAELTINLSSLRSDVFIDEFTLSIPNNFFSEKLIASIDTEGTEYKVESNKQGKRIIFSFPEPLSEESEFNHTIKLTYTHDDLYLSSNYIDELILPLIKTNSNTKVNVILHIPAFIKKEPSLIKPAASVVHSSKIEWKDVAQDTLYVQFGEFNGYALDLSYALSNSKLISTEQVIALPPDTLYQKIYVSSLKPEPDRTWIDEDGNYLASYKLGARENVTINFEGYAQVFIEPRDMVFASSRFSFEKQKNNLLTEKNLWSLGTYYKDTDIKSLQTPREIYDYIVSEFEYSKKRISSSPNRRGAEKALEEPFNSICTDFTDTFIAIAREKGIPAREIQGVGISEKEDIRPLTLKKDILHAWPEYYDEDRGIWVQVDPTWGKTSGIDYFNSFDSLHVALAIHGSDPTYPSPAGFYKIQNKKDVSIKNADSIPDEKTLIRIENTIPSKLITGKNYDATVSITNTGNTFIYDQSLTIFGDSINFQNNKLSIDQLAPFETKVINISFSPQQNSSEFESISFLYDGETLQKKTIQITQAENQTKMGVIGLIVALVIMLGSFFIVKIARS